MRPNGSECRLDLRLEENCHAIPFVEETLRAEPKIEKQEPLLGLGQPAYHRKRGERARGCFVTRVAAGILPGLLHVCLGDLEKPVHVPETRKMFATEASLTGKPEGLPCYDLVIDRGVERLRYGQLKTRGFELRARLEEALYLRLDVEGSVVESRVNPDPLTAAQDEEHFYFHPGDLLIDGSASRGVYEFALSVDTGLKKNGEGRMTNGEKRIICVVHAVLDEDMAQLGERDRHDIELRFRLRNTFPEPYRSPELRIRCEDMLLKKEQKEADSEGEILSPYTFSGRGALTARLVHEGSTP